MNASSVHAGPNGRADFSWKSLIGFEDGLKETVDLARRLAKTADPILICGETGTGKSRLARLIHEDSPRRNAPFVEIPLASINENLIESELFGHVRGAFTGAHMANPGKISLARQGTLFLDEIGELSLGAQTRLLHFLQEGYFFRVGGNHPEVVDVRVLSATNRNLPALVRQGKFREDLYFRLAVLRVDLPPLRKRGTDVHLHAARVLDDYAKQNGESIDLSAHAREQMMQYPWPGNVRELQNVLKRSLVCLRTGTTSIDELQFDHPSEASAGSSAPFSSGAVIKDPQEYALIREALIQHDGSLSKTALALGMSRFALYRRLKKLGVTKNAAVTWMLAEIPHIRA